MSRNRVGKRRREKEEKRRTLVKVILFLSCLITLGIALAAGEIVHFDGWIGIDSETAEEVMIKLLVRDVYAGERCLL